MTDCGCKTFKCGICVPYIYTILINTKNLATTRVLAASTDVSLLLLAGQLPINIHLFFFTKSAVLLTRNGASVAVS